jgi:excinuclease ABC subunit A
MQKIVLKKVRVHNLKGIDLTLKGDQLIVFTGVSGSGKSSLAFDTIYAEGQRRYIESLSTFAQRHLGDLPKPDAELITGISPTIAIGQRGASSNPRSTVGTLTGIYDYLRLLYARVGIAHCPVSGEAVAPQSTPAILKKIESLPEKTKVILLAPYARSKKGTFKEDFNELLRKGFTRVRLNGKIVELTDELSIDGHLFHDVDLVIDRLTITPDNRIRLMESITHALEMGKGFFTLVDANKDEDYLFSQYAYSPQSGLSYPPLEPQDFSFNHPLGMCPNCHGLGTTQEGICPSCLGARIRPYPAATELGGKRLAQLTALSTKESLQFFHQLKLSSDEQLIAEELIQQVIQHLSFLVDVGLHYLSLDRIAPTLSGGEAQRVRLSAHIGSGLVGATYILDEPSIGLHPQDNERLLKTLKKLRDKGNTLIVVEHDPETISAADEIVDVGPLAGALGGRIVAQGSLKTILNSKESLTGAYLSGRAQIPLPKKRRSANYFLKITGARHHNLKNVSVKIPLGLFIGITGLSGSGKSSLISETLFPALLNHIQGSTHVVGPYRSLTGFEKIDKVIGIDQRPIGRTPRSTPATYMKLFDPIRDLFIELPGSRALGLNKGHFSFNVKEGSCSHCQGMGMIKIDMDFMEDEWIICSQCQGKRFDQRVLSIHYRGKTIHEILEMSVREAHGFFAHLPAIHKKLELLLKVGLDYLQIGQPSPTLSGGEAQRIKLAKELSRPSTSKTFYILDEPTTGLHFYDIDRLIALLQELVTRGNTVLVIEHNMDLIKTTDWVIDLGPEGGSQGGEIIAEGRPEEIIKKKTPTAIALKKVMRTPLALEKKREKKKSSPSGAREIIVKGAAQNHLKEVSARIPHGKITLCTGPSGSGKSSFAFETIYAEGERRYIESLTTYARQFVKQKPKPKVENIEGLLAPIAIEQRNQAGNPRSTLGTLTEIYDYLRLLYTHLGTPYCPESHEKIEMITKESVVDRLFALEKEKRVQILSPLTLKKGESFEELRERLQGLGFLRIRLNHAYFELDEMIPFDAKQKNALFLVIDRMVLKEEARSRLLEAIDRASTLSGGAVVLDGGGEELFFNLAFAVTKTGKSYPPITSHTFSFNTTQGMCPDCSGLGVRADHTLCPACKGTRLGPLARHVRIDGLSIGDLSALSIEETSAFIDRLSVPGFLEGTLSQLKKRLQCLKEIGLGYLSLSRSAPTLSSGETQRARLARQLASGLTGALYVLDEPTIGLHPHDNALLCKNLRRFCLLGNTLLLIEQDPLTIENADYILDFGPEAGKYGGEITARGSLQEIKQNPLSLTGAYLSGRKRIPIPAKRRSFNRVISVKNASLHNLKGFDLTLPIQAFTCITGVSGSGKSTLLGDLLRPAAEQALLPKEKKDSVEILGTRVTGLSLCDQLLALDQNPIGHTNRADVSTYVDLLTPLRRFFTELPAAKMRGLQSKNFSFNHPKGMCTSCSGLGVRTIPLQFLPPVKVTCEACHGYRLNPLSLEVAYKGRHLGHLLQMSLLEVRSFLPPIAKILRILDTLISIGLGYLPLGQEIATLSGGEARRLRLSRELSKHSMGKTLYLFDEPTIGLHSEDVAKLLPTFHSLVDKGNTLILITHNLDIIANADYLIDLGPYAGAQGGHLIATGTPEAVAENPHSLTGRYLKNYFSARL